jgi:hypothetical protein
MILYTLVKSLVSRPICESSHVRGVSKIRVLNLTSGRTRQFIKLFSITFCKIRKSFPAYIFLPNESFCVINYIYRVRVVYTDRFT